MDFCVNGATEELAEPLPLTQKSIYCTLPGSRNALWRRPFRGMAGSMAYGKIQVLTRTVQLIVGMVRVFMIKIYSGRKNTSAGYKWAGNVKCRENRGYTAVLEILRKDAWNHGRK